MGISFVIAIGLFMIFLQMVVGHENGFGSHGERFLRAVVFSWTHRPTPPANCEVGVATKTGFS
jgi:hypothetical protein